MTVTMIPDLPGNVVGFIAEGEISAADYTDAIEPAVDAALAGNEKIRLLYVLGPAFDGFAAGAAWEDGKLGMGHLTRWEKIAFVSDKEWMRHAVNAVGYLLPGKVKVFSNDEEADATRWITED